jgi:hypothetical protein
MHQLPLELQELQQEALVDLLEERLLLNKISNRLLKKLQVVKAVLIGMALQKREQEQTALNNLLKAPLQFHRLIIYQEIQTVESKVQETV